MLIKVISGGQTGVDRAALDAALACGLPIGGYCPRGRKAEDGRIPDKYPLTEMPTTDYPARTRKNVEEADATLIFTTAKPSPGTLSTAKICRELDKPMLPLAVDMPLGCETIDFIRRWIDIGEFKVMNVAGPRASRCPGGYDAVYGFLCGVFKEKIGCK